jgi:hypothetical protein
MAGGGKGGSTTTTTQIPAWLEQAAQRNIAKGEEQSRIGYVPFSGPEVAAMTPQQIQAMQNTNMAASAFGLGSVDPMAGMPEAQTFAGGVQGYSSLPMYEQALAELQRARPGQFAALMAPFIDPVTGAQPLAPYGNVGMMGQGMPGQVDPRATGQRSGERDAMRQNANASGGYTGLRDMVNGGGPGQSGSTFSGGGMVSGALNAAGVSPRGSGGRSSGSGGGK